MEVNPLLKYVMKEEKEDIFHSSAYGKAQSSGGMGATSSETFATRVKREQDRQLVKGYGSSSVANRAIGNGPRAKVFTPSAKGGMSSGPRPMSPRNPGISR